jgi:mono/diheme cytochrome c family protein
MLKQLLGITLLSALAAGCRLEMHDQPKRDPDQASRFFANGASSRPLVTGTIPRGALRTNDVYFAGLQGTNFVPELPVPITRALLERGRERFDIYCSVCHGATGEGNGMIVQRGFPRPPSFHTERLRAAPAGYFYRVISEGYGVMFPYATRVSPADRWAIVSYVRALQLSTTINIADLPPVARQELERMPQ